MHHASITAPEKLPGPHKARWARLMRDLDLRQREDDIYTHAYVTQAEAWWLNGWGLKQPGHTRHQYSTASENLSDAAQL